MTSISSCKQLLLAIYVIHCLILIQAAPRNSLVKKLPGFSGKFPSNHYSGYVSIGKHNSKHMFYYYVESERNPANDSVVLWLNGGPGCSSLEGFINEHGPFLLKPSSRINSTDLPTLYINPYSWSKVSNIIYLDTPVGTGFSFSRNASDYITGDLKTAFDTHKFLLKWFKMFPERIHNPFFIAGESYAGVFVPTIASKIVDGLNSGLRPIINLEGYLIGNGVADDYFDGNGVVPFAHGMGLISDQLYQDIVHTCNGSYATPPSKDCEDKLNEIDDVTISLNTYNILEQCYETEYVDHRYICGYCVSGQNINMDDTKLRRSFGRSLLKQSSKRVRPIHKRTSPDHGLGVTSTGSQPVNSLLAICHNMVASDVWFNHETVRKAIHVAEESVTGRWDECTDLPTYDSDVGSLIDYHKSLISKGLRVLIYSGDHDMVVPYTGSEAWTRSLGYKIIDGWRPWISNAQVAGFVQGYDKNFTFMTVKGAGHMVPADKPREALDFYSRWLSGKKI